MGIGGIDYLEGGAGADQFVLGGCQWQLLYPSWLE